MKDSMICPNCRYSFVNRKNKRCPKCKIRLVYPGEIFYPDTEGFFWRGNSWVRLSEIKKNKEEMGQNDM